MIGRAAYDNPYLFAPVDQAFWQGNEPIPDRHEVVARMLPYIEHWTSQGLKLHKITRHMLQLFTHQPGSRAWKRHLTENSCKPDAGIGVVQQALAMVPEPTIETTAEQ